MRGFSRRCAAVSFSEPVRLSQTIRPGPNSAVSVPFNYLEIPGMSPSVASNPKSVRPNVTLSRRSRRAPPIYWASSLNAYPRTLSESQNPSPFFLPLAAVGAIYITLKSLSGVRTPFFPLWPPPTRLKATCQQLDYRRRPGLSNRLEWVSC